MCCKVAPMWIYNMFLQLVDSSKRANRNICLNSMIILCKEEGSGGTPDWLCMICTLEFDRLPLFIEMRW